MKLKSKQRRPANRRLPQPFRQGELDSLCGVYSTVNALRALCPEIDKEAGTWLFNCLMCDLPDGVKPEYAVTEGVWRSKLERVIRQAINAVSDEYDIVLRVKRPPKKFRNSADLKTFWQWLACQLSPTRVAIIGLGGRHSHWTVAVAMTHQQIRLYDSGELKVLRRRGCTVGRANSRSSISPAHVFVINRAA